MAGCRGLPCKVPAKRIKSDQIDPISRRAEGPIAEIPYGPGILPGQRQCPAPRRPLACADNRAFP